MRCHCIDLLRSRGPLDVANKIDHYIVSIVANCSARTTEITPYCKGPCTFSKASPMLRVLRRQFRICVHRMKVETNRLITNVVYLICEIMSISVCFARITGVDY